MEYTDVKMKRLVSVIQDLANAGNEFAFAIGQQFQQGIPARIMFQRTARQVKEMEEFISWMEFVETGNRPATATGATLHDFPTASNIVRSK